MRMAGKFYSNEFKSFIVSFAATDVNVPMVARLYGVNHKITHRWENDERFHDKDMEMLLLRDKAVSMYEVENKTIEDIAVEINIHHDIVHVWVTGTYIGPQNGVAGKITNKLADLIFNDYKNGMTLYEIKDKYGVGESGVRRISKERGFDKRTNLSTDEIDTIIKLYSEGLKLEDIAKQVNRARYVISNTINKHAPELRRNTFTLHSEESKINIITLYVDEGLSISQVEKLTGVNSGSIYKILKEDGVNRSLSAGGVGKRAGKVYKDGSSFLPYCEKFDKGLKDRVAAYYDYKCALCGFEETGGKYILSTHHVLFNQMACCDGSPRLFIPLCISCHGKVTGKKNKQFYIQQFLDAIYKNDESGKCYYSEKEYKQIFNRCPYDNYNKRMRYFRNKRNGLIPEL